MVGCEVAKIMDLKSIIEKLHFKPVSRAQEMFLQALGYPVDDEGKVTGKSHEGVTVPFSSPSQVHRLINRVEKHADEFTRDLFDAAGEAQVQEKTRNDNDHLGRLGQQEANGMAGITQREERHNGLGIRSRR